MQLVGESVAAESGTQWDWDFLASPGNRANWVPKWGFKTHAPTFDPRFDGGGRSSRVFDRRRRRVGPFIRRSRRRCPIVDGYRHLCLLGRPQRHRRRFVRPWTRRAPTFWYYSTERWRRRHIWPASR